MSVILENTKLQNVVIKIENSKNREVKVKWIKFENQNEKANFESQNKTSQNRQVTVISPSSPCKGTVRLFLQLSQIFFQK